jgi:hypothetical protein
MAYSASSFEKRGFQMTLIFNGCKPLKMLAHPCAKPIAKKTFLKTTRYAELGTLAVFCVPTL